MNGCVLTAARCRSRRRGTGCSSRASAKCIRRFQTPGAAILWSGVWTVVLILTGSYETLYSYSILAAWIFYTMTVARRVRAAAQAAGRARGRTGCGGTRTRLWLFVGVSVWFIGNCVGDAAAAFDDGASMIAAGRRGLSRLAQEKLTTDDHATPTASGAKRKSPVRLSASTTTVWPSRISPFSSRRPSGVSIFFWMARFSGRAP